MPNELAITIFLVGIVVAIMIHEWGHFATARWFGMRADRFFLGFGPTLWSTQRGETEYGVKALPIGGFVRIKGMSPTDERLRPVADVMFDPDRVAADRRALAGSSGRALEDQPTFGEPTWERLARVLEERGTPAEVGQRVVHRARLNIPEDATVPEARIKLAEIFASEIPSTGKAGDLHHRVMRGDEGRFFHDRPAWERAVVLVSGSVMHFVQAFVLLFAGYLFFGGVVAIPEVDSVEPDSPAAEIGLQSGDRITAIDGEPVADFESVRETIRSHPGEPIALTIQRGEDTIETTAIPRVSEDPESGESVGLLGFRPALDYQPVPADQAMYEAVLGPASVPSLTVQTFVSLGRVFGPEGIGMIFGSLSGDQERDQEGAISMVGAAQAAGSGTTAFGPLFLFVLLASVNVFVGIFNLLPLPPLDGGHLAVLGIERSVNAVRRVTGRPDDFSIDPRTIAAVAIPVIVFIGTISIALVWLDVVNPIQIGQ